MVWEVDAISAKTNSTTQDVSFRAQQPEFNYTRMREKALRNESLETNNARDLEQVVRIFVEVNVVSAFSNSTTPGCDQSHPKTKKQTKTKRGKQNEH